ncbi:MAG: DUF3536 domain-containing protein [Desulfovibrio sp.]
MSGLLCIHGHFYQPPREDPWLQCILPEGTAAPAVNWNRRILDESYAPLAFARRQDGQGRIAEIVNCYEWMNFNVGPTLLSWLERRAPQVYARMLEADRRSLTRWGHGNAMAQVYHHAILPLATLRDRRLEIAWALDDFEARFRRRAEGLWLSEAAVDTPTLEIMAEMGLRFTILAPHQAEAVAGPDGQWRAVDEGDVDVRRPYRVELPSGRNLAVFFYNGPLSRAVAFEGLLADGERFWQRLAGQGADGLLSLGTDGETYGHHFRFGEMALAYVLEQARNGRDGWSLTNYSAYLADHPPAQSVRLHERTSWSCAHGVERWRSDCGCTDGGHPGYNQRWRGPLRDGLNAVKAELDRHYDQAGAEVFAEPENALLAYGLLLAHGVSPQEFQRQQFQAGLFHDKVEKAWNLLEMQRFGLSMFASCAWFFDDMARVEPRNALAFCLRAMECCRSSGGPELEPLLLEHLRAARPNDERFADGEELYRREALTRRQTPARLVALGLMQLRAKGELPEPGGEAVTQWIGAQVAVARAGKGPGETDAEFAGTALLRFRHAGQIPGEARRCRWRWLDADMRDFFAGELVVDCGQGEEKVRPHDLHWKLRQETVLEALERMGRKDRALLENQIREARLFLEYRAHQNTPQLAPLWAARWPALIVALVWHGIGADNRDFVEFLRTTGAQHPARLWLEQRFGREIFDWLSAGQMDTEALLALLGRSRAAGLYVDLWGVQNYVWERGLHREDAALAEALGLRN